MRPQTAKQSMPSVEPDKVRQSLDSILNSKYFVNAPKKKAFLRLICNFYLEGRAHELNEYVLGYDVFDRDKTYEPSADPVVRVTAYEIRKKLEAYYQHEGIDDPFRLEIPAGSYEPIFTPHTSEAAALAPLAPPVVIATETAPATTAAERRRLPIAGLVLSFAVLALAVAVAVLSLANRDLRRKTSGADRAKDPAMYGAVWAPFMESSSPPLVVLSNPPALRLSNASDPEILTKESIPLPPAAVAKLREKLVTNPEVLIRESAAGPGSTNTQERKTVIRQNQSPSLIISTDVFTGVGEAIGLHYLGDLFRSADKSIVLKQSRTLSAEDLKNHDVIVLGGIWVNEWSGKLTATEDFAFTDYGTIKNRNIQPGEEGEFIPQFDKRTGGLLADYALITVKPNISDANSVMKLAGIYSQGTEAAAEFVTDLNYLNQLNQRLDQLKRQGKSPRYFQALLMVGVENGIPTTIKIVSLHVLRGAER